MRLKRQHRRTVSRHPGRSQIWCSKHVGGDNKNMKRILLWSVSLCLLLCGVDSAVAQMTKSAIITQIVTCFPDQMTGAITPAVQRQCLDNIVNSYQQFTAVRSVTVTTDTFLPADYGQLITYNNSSAIAVTLPQGLGSFFPWNAYVSNLGNGTVTITPTSSTIGGSSSLALAKGQSVQIVSDASGNYQIIGLSATGTTLAVGASVITGGTSNGLLYNNAGLLGNLATGNNGVLITSGAGIPSVSSTLPSGIAATNMVLTTPTLGVASGTSLALGGASIGTNTLSLAGTTLLTAGTIASNANAFQLTGTLTDTASSTQNGVLISIASAGNAANEVQRAFRSLLSAGYTGAGTMEANSLSTQTASTANTIIPAAESISGLANIGAGMGASGSTSGGNIGGLGHAVGANTNVGLIGLAQVSQNGGQNFGVVGSGYNAGSGTIATAGGFFTLNGALPTNISAALIADNGTQSNPVFLGRVNGVTVHTIDLNGGTQIATAAALTAGAQAFSIVATQPTSPVAAQNAIA